LTDELLAWLSVWSEVQFVCTSLQTDNYSSTEGKLNNRPPTKRITELHKTHTHPFNGPLSGTTRVSRYQRGKTNLDFTEARDSEWQWHQLGHMQVCTSLQTDNHVSTPPLGFFTGRMPFLPPNQQRQSTEGTNRAAQKQKINFNNMSMTL